jgi:hypothetical protein
MIDRLKLGFGPLVAPPKGVLVVYCDDGLKFGPATRKALGPAADLVARAAKAERFTGKSGAALELAVPQGLKAARLIVIGVGKAADLKQKDFLKFGGLALGKLPLAAADATVFAELPAGAMKPEQAADLAQGVALRVDLYERSDAEPSKRLVVHKVKKVQGYWTAMDSSMTELASGNATRLIVEKILYNRKLPASLFTTETLEDESLEEDYRP